MQCCAPTRMFFLLLFSAFFINCEEAERLVDHDLLLKAQRFSDPGIYDKDGRFMLMRGVNLNTLGDYGVANPAVPTVAAYRPDHFAIMAEYGFNVVRLVINWSALEPVRGAYNMDYIARIQGAIEDAAVHGIYTILDMHQDAYSKYTVTPDMESCEFPNKGWDGAPDWATFTDGASTCTVGGQRESTPAVYNAFRNLWNNRDGIQDALIDAWQELVKHTASYPTVIGYDAFNEPSLGNGDYYEQGWRYNKFLGKLVDAIREAEEASGGYEHIFFFETTITWAGQELPFTPAFDFTDDENIIFAPHNYFEVIVQDIFTIEQGAQLFQTLADQYGSGVLIGEWGVFGDPESQRPKLERFAAAEDRFLMSSTWWQWCQAPGDPHAIDYSGTQFPATDLHILEVAADGSYTGVRNEVYLKVLGRARAVAIAGRPIRMNSDPETGILEVEARLSGSGVTSLWASDRFGIPEVGGTGVLSYDLMEVAGGYLIDVRVEGTYSIILSY